VTQRERARKRVTKRKRKRKMMTKIDRESERKTEKRERERERVQGWQPCPCILQPCNLTVLPLLSLPFLPCLYFL
jgi:hypothetical protein